MSEAGKAVLAGIDMADTAGPVEPKNTTKKNRVTPRKKPGRKPAYDQEKDRKFIEDWESCDQSWSLPEFARESGVDPDEAQATYDRARAKRKRMSE